MSHPAIYARIALASMVIQGAQADLRRELNAASLEDLALLGKLATADETMSKAIRELEGAWLGIYLKDQK